MLQIEKGCEQKNTSNDCKNEDEEPLCKRTLARTWQGVIEYRDLVWMLSRHSGLFKERPQLTVLSRHERLQYIRRCNEGPVTVQPHHRSLIRALMFETTQRWLRITTQDASVSTAAYQSNKRLDVGRTTRAHDCANYTTCLDVAAADEFACGHPRNNDNWTCNHACPCYLVDTPSLPGAGKSVTYWMGKHTTQTEMRKHDVPARKNAPTESS